MYIKVIEWFPKDNPVKVKIKFPVAIVSQSKWGGKISKYIIFFHQKLNIYCNIICWMLHNSILSTHTKPTPWRWNLSKKILFEGEDYEERIMADVIISQEFEKLNFKLNAFYISGRCTVSNASLKKFNFFNSSSNIIYCLLGWTSMFCFSQERCWKGEIDVIKLFMCRENYTIYIAFSAQTYIWNILGSFMELLMKDGQT